MVDSSRTIMTDAGFALETRVHADETKMQFTRAAISTDDHFSDTDDALAKLTELSNIQQDGKVTAVQVINTTTVYVQVDVNQAESKADYQMRSAALYAKDDDGTEVLYGVTVLQDPVFVHKDADGSYLGFGINTTVGRASNVVVVVDPANMVTQQVFESTMKNYYTKAEVDAKFVTDDDFASKLPKNIATTDAANTFAKSQTLAGGATDGKGNAYATTKDVATGLKNGFNTKVNVSDMRKPANQVASIDEVNTKQDKIGYMPADDSKVVHDNKDNTIQVNGTQVNPYNKLSDTIGGRNLAPNTSDDWQKVSVPGGWGPVYLSNQIYEIKDGETYTLQVEVRNITSAIMLEAYNFTAAGARNGLLTPHVSASDDTKIIVTFTAKLPENYAYFQPNLAFSKSLTSAGSYEYRRFKLEEGNVAIDWTPAPADKVNVSDMRKPASDVAGIEEVNAKQDKLDYTPANDTNVVHRNPDTGRATDTTDFPYKGLTVDGYPIIPLVLVPDRATAITKTAQYPNYAFMYGKELS